MSTLRPAVVRPAWAAEAAWPVSVCVRVQLGVAGPVPQPRRPRCPQGTPGTSGLAQTEGSREGFLEEATPTLTMPLAKQRCELGAGAARPGGGRAPARGGARGGASGRTWAGGRGAAALEPPQATVASLCDVHMYQTSVLHTLSVYGVTRQPHLRAAQPSPRGGFRVILVKPLGQALGHGRESCSPPRSDKYQQ